MTRLRDLGEAHVCSAAGNAIAVRVAVLLTDGESAAGWGGQIRPYRPLALTPGRYTLRIRGEDLGLLTVRSLRPDGDTELADFVGEGAPTERLRGLIEGGGMAYRVHEARFPRVAGEVEPTALAMILGPIGAVLKRLVSVPSRLSGRRRSSSLARPRR
jgi:hypothetical protein